jgi:hypothetical protein
MYSSLVLVFVSVFMLASVFMLVSVFMFACVSVCVSVSVSVSDGQVLAILMVFLFSRPSTFHLPPSTLPPSAFPVPNCVILLQLESWRAPGGGKRLSKKMYHCQ